MKERDVKTLWGRAAGRCAICGRKLTRDTTLATDAMPFGEHAHIVGDRPGSARYEEGLKDAQRDGYANRILLCPTDHTIVDKATGEWSVARLHIAKAEHELNVESKLTTDLRTEAHDRIYSDVMDFVTETLVLERFSVWASGLMEPYWVWPRATCDGIDRLRYRIFATDWPGTLPGLEVALDRASFELQEAVVLFGEYSGVEGENYRAKRWYKQTLHPQDVYERLDSDFWLWSETLEARIVEATAAMNWVRQVWRAEVNPMWLASSGWFTLQLHPDATMRSSFLRPEYTEEERAMLLDRGVGQADIRAPKVSRRR